MSSNKDETSSQKTLTDLSLSAFDVTEAPVKLYPYQVEGIEWLSNEATRFKFLADEMGLGKTIQVIRAADRLSKIRRIVVLCPAIARFNWAREINRFSEIEDKTTKVITTSKNVSPDPSIRWTICSYDLAPKIKWPDTIDLLVCDEAHFLKNPHSIRTKAILCTRTALAAKAARTWAVSGTPTPNHAGEMWPWLFTFSLTPLSHTDFLKHYCTYYIHLNRVNVTGTKPSLIPEFRRLIAPVLLRRTKDEVMIDLPPLTFKTVVVPANPVDVSQTLILSRYTWPEDRSKELYAELARQEYIVKMNLEQLSFRRAGFEVLMNLARSLSTLRMYTGLQKVDAAIDMIRSDFENKAYDKLVIFAIHVDVIRTLKIALDQYGPVTIFGASNPVTRENNIRRFNESKGCKIIICNIQAAGTAINLTRANNVLFVETDWTPSYVQQAIMRCHRIGQKKHVHVRMLALKDSIDEHITRAFMVKMKQLTAIYAKETVEAISQLDPCKPITINGETYEPKFNSELHDIRRDAGIYSEDDFKRLEGDDEEELRERIEFSGEDGT